MHFLQDNLIRSHSAGVGQPLSREQTRRLLALRINVLAKGYSGIRPETVSKMVAAFNADCLSVVPSQGTVGASGDLAPLSHLALGLMGEGKMWDPDTGVIAPSATVLEKHGLTPIQLEAKEGLAMINGTQLMSSISAEAVTRAATLAHTADIACALSVEALKGTPRAFEACIHATRPHKGQQAVAAKLLKLLTPVSEVCQAILIAEEICRNYIDSSPSLKKSFFFVSSIFEIIINSAPLLVFVSSLLCSSFGVTTILGKSKTPTVCAAHLK